MADGIAPAIDKVAAPAPGAPEAEAGAPTVVPTSAPAPAEDKPAEEKPAEERPVDSKPAALEGAGPAVGPPKPVEVLSVPQTPLDNNTPAGGTPRPVLNVDEPTVTTGVNGPEPTATTSAPKDDFILGPSTDASAPVNGASKEPVEVVEMAGALPADKAEPGDKRKLDEPEAKATNGGAPAAVTADEPVDKKVKLNGGEASKPAKAKKEKKSPPAPGKTARKTRSQGPVEA